MLMKEKKLGTIGPIGPLGAVGICPACVGIKIKWSQTTDISRCLECGWDDSDDVLQNNNKRKMLGELR